jgi:hypothetical protein
MKPVFKLMISHATADRPLAAAWQKMLTTVIPDADVWHSSDRAAFPPGRDSDFAMKIEEEIRSAEFLLTIQTPNSRMRPWLIWEAGLARGAKTDIFVVLYGIKPGKTETPLDGQHQYSQDPSDKDPNDWKTCIKNVEDIVGHIIKSPKLKDRKLEFTPGALTDAINDYITTVREHAQLLECESVYYDKRIRIVLTETQLVALKNGGRLPDDVRVEGVGNSLSIFGFLQDAHNTSWRLLMDKLKDRNDFIPFPGSAVRWAEALGRFLARAVTINIHLNIEAEALPLYIDYFWTRPSAATSYRPAVSRRIIEAGEITFEVAFAQLPPELVAHPESLPAPLYHYISFCRMIRWGLLQPQRFDDLFSTKELGEEAEKKVDDFATVLMNIRIEFLNRGLNQQELVNGFPEALQPRANKLREQWLKIVGPLEPDKHPSVGDIRKAYPKMLRINKAFFGYVVTAMRTHVAGLKG